MREVIPLDEREERSARTYNVPLTHNSVRPASPTPFTTALTRCALC